MRIELMVGLKPNDKSNNKRHAENLNLAKYKRTKDETLNMATIKVSICQISRDKRGID